jgi:paraquat-inducible protein B
MGDARDLLRDTNERIASVGSGAEQTLAETRNLINNINSRVEPIQGQLSNALQAAGDAIKRVEETLGEIENTTRSDSLLVVRLTRTLQEFENLARSVRVLADFLERHPEALIKGKKSPGGR